ncbi:MAG: hypothetical protein IKI57_02945 [Clostridia bacterium]|nr:hypothetical protein [Clostridia bacterium]
MKNLVLSLLLILVIICFIGCEDENKIPINSEESGELIPIVEIDKEDLSSPYYFENNIIHGITMKDTILYKTLNNDEPISTIKEKTNVNILNAKLDNMYEIEVNGNKGFVNKSDIKYFIYNAKNKYTLACDVSGFNFKREFFKKEDFEKYLLEYDFNYAIIRLGGRGYGKAGNMYYDEKVDIFVDACEYLGVPYGFYFLDEALNEEEVHAEFEFALEKYKKYDGKFHLLPLSIDMENQHGDGRADNIWDERVTLVNLLIDDFKNANIDCMLYANGARIETYLKDVNCPYWTAAYTLDDKIPIVFYDDFIKKEQQKNREDENNIIDSILNTKVNKGDTETIWYSDKYLDKVVAWQFTETAASLDGISGTLDLNLMKNDYFVPICIDIYK